jgi:GT2 family glycosyltransferase
VVGRRRANLSERAEVAVVVPTVGRARQLSDCLASLEACRPRPAEVIVADQSGLADVAEAIRGATGLDIRHVAIDGKGAARARNAGVRATTHEVVFMTDDDCTVAPDWIAVGVGHMEAGADTIVSGRVLGGGGKEDVPSLRDDETAREWTGALRCDVVYTGNVVGPRTALLELGPFDERLLTAEDNDLCYRWLTSGRRLIYDPALLVWHHHWRSPEELNKLYASYHRGQGAFYAKHLRRGDRRIFDFIAHDIRTTLRRLPRELASRDGTPDFERRMLRGELAGLLRSWRAFRR